MCENNIKTARDKIYFQDARIRKKWCKASVSLYCCKDHFDASPDLKSF